MSKHVILYKVFTPTMYYGAAGEFSPLMMQVFDEQKEAEEWVVNVSVDYAEQGKQLVVTFADNIHKLNGKEV